MARGQQVKPGAKTQRLEARSQKPEAKTRKQKLKQNRHKPGAEMSIGGSSDYFGNKRNNSSLVAAIVDVFWDALTAAQHTFFSADICRGGISAGLGAPVPT